MAYIQKNNPFKEDGESPFQLAQWRKNRRRKMRLFGEGWFDPIKDFFKKKSKAKKPTNKDIVIVINSLIQEIQAMKSDIRTLSGVTNMYIEYKGDSDGFEKHVDKQVKKENSEIQEDAESSTESA